jgi:AraC-like DNA-binding protein
MDIGFMDCIANFHTNPRDTENKEGLFQCHSHQSAELTLLIKGEGYYAAGEQNVEALPGDLLLIPANLKHSYVCINAWEGYSLHIYDQNIPAYCQYLMSHAFTQRQGPILKASLTPGAVERALAAMHQIEETCKRKEQTEYSYDLLRNALETLLLTYHTGTCDKAGKKVSSEHPEEQFIEDALKEIHQNYHMSLKVSDLAASHYLSESIFRKKFIKHVGVLPKQYIITLRIDEAKRLLLTSRKPVEFIASEVGFSSSSRFHDLFVKHVGMTPMEWRRTGER